MNQKAIEAEIKNYKIREGSLYKRSKFLKEWRQRWVVVTMNFMFTFTNKSCQEVTDVIDLKDVKSYKSYLRKDQEMIPVGIKIRTSQDMYYFCAKSSHEKWSWMVTLQRLMDYKYVGATSYNNVDFIRTKGFQSQIEFQSGGKIEKPINPNDQKTIPQQIKQIKKNIDSEAERIMKELKDQEEQLKKKQRQLKQKQASFMIEKQQLKKQESIKKQEPIKQPQPIKKPSNVEKQQSVKVSQLKNLYEQKIQQSSKGSIPSYNSIKIVEKKPSQRQIDQKGLHLSRAKVVTGLFDQLIPYSQSSMGFKYFIDFLVKVGSDQRLGYNSFVVYESKTHQNRKTFAQVFIELLTDYKDYQNCVYIANFIQICVFESPGLFSPNQNRVIKKKLLEFLLNNTDQQKLQIILKNMFIMHKLERYQKTVELVNRLQKIVTTCKRDQVRNWAKKLKQDL